MEIIQHQCGNCKHWLQHDENRGACDDAMERPACKRPEFWPSYVYGDESCSAWAELDSEDSDFLFDWETE